MAEKSKYRKAVEGIMEVMYPGGDPDAQWTVATIEHVADVLRRNGFEPVYSDAPRDNPAHELDRRKKRTLRRLGL